MSDAVILAAITGCVTVIVAAIGVVNLWLTRNINIKTKAVEQKVEKLATEVDGKITQLIDTTNKLADAKVVIAGKEGMEKGKADHKEEVKVIKEELRIETQIIKEEIKTDAGQVQQVEIAGQVKALDVKIEPNSVQPAQPAQPVTIVGQEKPVDVKIDKGKT